MTAAVVIWHGHTKRPVLYRFDRKRELRRRRAARKNRRWWA